MVINRLNCQRKRELAICPRSANNFIVEDATVDISIMLIRTGCRLLIREIDMHTDEAINETSVTIPCVLANR